MRASMGSWGGTAVHPHGRGDNRALPVKGAVRRGSPPRAWGQLCGFLTVASPVRFTPTGVGTIAAANQSHAAPSVHPHGRGDNLAPHAAPEFDFGSPPRAWGQLVGYSDARVRARFTPTGVGTIFVLLAWFCLPSVHPHGRGDNRECARDAAVACGSPPRAWGQYRLQRLRIPGNRFTPTGVGTIVRPSSLRPVRSVLPHGRGDNRSGAP